MELFIVLQYSKIYYKFVFFFCLHMRDFIFISSDKIFENAIENKHQWKEDRKKSDWYEYERMKFRRHRPLMLLA